MAAIPAQGSTVLLDDGSAPAGALRAAIADRSLEIVRDGDEDRWARLTRARCVLLPLESPDAGVHMLRRLREDGFLGASIFYAERAPDSAVRAGLLAGAQDVLDPDCQAAPELRRAATRAIERHEARAQMPHTELSTGSEDMVYATRAELELTHEREFSTALLAAVRDGFMYTRDGVIAEVNDELCAITGFPKQQLVGRRPPYPFCAPEHPVVHAELGGSEEEVDDELILMRRSGQRFEAAISTRPSIDAAGQVTGYVTTIRDMSAERRHQRQLARMAERDPLTDLLNHRTFHQRLRGEIKRAQRHERPLSLALLDLDHLGRVNDVHGHFAGDGVLLEATRRILLRAREGEPVGRLGGEEFGWILPETDIEGAFAAADAVRRSIADEEFRAAGEVSISAGVCSLAEARNEVELFRLADAALKKAKDAGGDKVVAHGLLRVVAS